MRLVDLTCPNCSAQLKVDADKKQAFCEYCGTVILIDDEVQRVQFDNAEEAGYKFEKGRQRALAEARKQQTYQAPVKELPKKKRTWLWVLGWLCIFPIPLTILMLRNKKMKPALKYGIIAVAWIFYLIIAAVNSDESTQTNKESVVEQTATAASTEAPVAVEYDSLQKIFLTLNAYTTEDDLLNLINEYGVEYTVKDYNGTPKTTGYKLAYTEGVAKQSYADEGDNLEVSFSKEDGSLLNAEYFNHTAFKDALFYSYGPYWSFREKEQNNKYSGYYYYKPGDTKGGITIEYENGNSTETGYYACDSGEEAINNAIAK